MQEALGHRVLADKVSVGLHSSGMFKPEDIALFFNSRATKKSNFLRYR